MSARAAARNRTNNLFLFLFLCFLPRVLVALLAVWPVTVVWRGWKWALPARRHAVTHVLAADPGRVHRHLLDGRARGVLLPPKRASRGECGASRHQSVPQCGGELAPGGDLIISA